MNPKRTRRRDFLKTAPAVAGVAAVAMEAAGTQAFGADAPASAEQLRSYGQRSHFVTSERVGTIRMWPTTLQPRDYAFRTPLQDLVGMVTPASLHYILSHGFDPPEIDPAQHRLLIHGMVDRPLIFTVDELKRLPSVSRIHFIECGGNSSPRLRRDAQTVQQTHGWTSCSEWTGVPLSLLLKEAGVQKGGTWLVAESAD